MIAVDSNLLVYAHREDTSWHNAAYARIVELAEGSGSLGDPMALYSRISIHCDASSDICSSHTSGKGHRPGRGLA